MRIIAGCRRGAQLFAPPGRETRPTQDRVKESLFNIIQSDVAEAKVLDLFAGSGALGLEALSRGAAHAALVDMDRGAVACIRRNVEKLGFQERVSLYSCDWRQAAGRIGGQGERFGLVFLDPPYRITDLGRICDALETSSLLAKDALLVLEHSAGVRPALRDTFECVNERRYGDTEIHFYRYRGEGMR